MREETIVLGGGCFWCIEAVLAELEGVLAVRPGYAGGTLPNPTYEQVCTGKTGHAEVAEIRFDSAVISLHDLLTVFFTLHDPTTLNRQGADIGTQYRSAVFFGEPEQESAVRQVMAEIEAAKVWPGPLVTQVRPLEAFYPAEDYHRDYFARHADQPYCQVVIAPKVAKLRQLYRTKLKR